MEDFDDINDPRYNQYSDSPNEEQEEEETTTQSTPMVEKRKYKGSFAGVKDEQFGCPYASCGRKFVSAEMLKQHIERRHAPHLPQPPKKQVESKQQPEPIKQIQTPLHVKELKPKQYEEDKINDGKRGFFQAQPRPVTSHGRQNQQVSIQQQRILQEMMGGSNNSKIFKRPKTAATTTKKDEDRIKKKIFTLEQIERKIEEDIEEFNNRKKTKAAQGLRVTKQMLLDASQCDELSEIQAIILREKNIEVFDDNKQDGLKMEDLVNCEAIYATHNLIRDIFGICQITTLVELNLSFNQISDIQPLEDLILLQKLWLNRNNILVIDPLKSLKKLEVLGLFNNEIFNERKALEVLDNLQNLKELSIDGNPVSSQVSFKYELTMRLPKLEILDDEPIKELDREIAEQFFLQNKLPLPGTGIIKKQQEEGQVDNNEEKENKQVKTKKSVKFMKQSIDDDGDTWQGDEIKKLETKCAELIVENEGLKEKLQQKKFDQTYKENERLKLELKNMYILQEENRDLKEDFERLKSLTYEDRMKDLVGENEQLRKRNGMLLIQVSELERKLQDLEKSKQNEHLQYQKNFSASQMQRPSTSAGAFMRKREDMQMTGDDLMQSLDDTAQDDFDKELDLLIMKNQQRLAELQNEVKEVSKIVGEPVVNVRKLKTIRTVKGVNKVLAVKQQQSNDRVKALGADAIDADIDN